MEHTPLLIPLIQRATDTGFQTILVTNANWATDKDTACAALEVLRRCGLRSIQISLDDQHQAQIPIARVANALAAAKSLTFESIKILGSSRGNTEQFKYQLFHLSQILGISLDGVALVDRERTSHAGFEDPDQRRFSVADLERAAKLGLPVNVPDDCLSELMIDVNGDVYPCCNNFVGPIGTVTTSGGLIRIIQNCMRNPHFRQIKTRGIFDFVRSLDSAYGTAFVSGQYANWCELCSRVFDDARFTRSLLAPYSADGPPPRLCSQLEKGGDAHMLAD